MEEDWDGRVLRRACFNISFFWGGGGGSFLDREKGGRYNTNQVLWIAYCRIDSGGVAMLMSEESGGVSLWGYLVSDPAGVFS